MVGHMLSRTFPRWIAMLLLCAVAVGCRARPTTTHDCSGIVTTQAINPLSVLESGHSQGVTTNFEGLDSNSNQDPMSFFGESLTVDLKDALCLASRNSKLANLIEKERKAVCCEAGCIKCVEQFLKSQAQEQRIKSAADAAELLIRLSGTQLQSEILNQSLAKVADLQETVDAAHENGLATADAQSELDKQLIELERKQIEIDSGVFEINAKLNLLLGLDSCYPRRIAPEYQFVAQAIELNTQQLIIQALSNRPELNSLSGINACSGEKECLAILSSIDRRIGLAIPKPVRRLLLRERREEQEKCGCQIRQQQIDELKILREEMIRQDVLSQTKEVHRQQQLLKLENEYLLRLQSEAELIESAAVLDAQDSFVDSIKNFAQQQIVKSQRATALVEFEVAKLRLDEATGSLPTQCESVAAGSVRSY